MLYINKFINHLITKLLITFPSLVNKATSHSRIVFVAEISGAITLQSHTLKLPVRQMVSVQ